jgi:hypothetical protein
VRLPFAAGFTAEAARFQWRLLVVLALIVLVTAAAVLLAARHNIAREEEHRRETEFQVSLALLRRVQADRHAALVERGRALATKSRIQAALEDNAEDLLYLSARDELRDLLAAPAEPAAPGAEPSMPRGGCSRRRRARRRASWRRPRRTGFPCPRCPTSPSSATSSCARRGGSRSCSR